MTTCGPLSRCLLLGLAACLAGCSTQAKWTYPLQGERLVRFATTPENLALAVFPFREERPVGNSSATRAIHLVPLAPFGWVTYERPEAARDFNTIEEYDFDVDEDLGKAATRSFEQSGLFRRVYFTLGGETRESDLILRGTALRTTYDGKIYSYGISVFAGLFWLIGLPTGSSTNRLEIELHLTDKDGAPLWSYGFKQSEGIVQGLYYNSGEDMTNLASLTEEAMNGALQDLSAKLPTIVAYLKGNAPSPVAAPAVPNAAPPPPLPSEAPAGPPEVP